MRSCRLARGWRRSCSRVLPQCKKVVGESTFTFFIFCQLPATVQRPQHQPHLQLFLPLSRVSPHHWMKPRTLCFRVKREQKLRNKLRDLETSDSQTQFLKPPPNLRLQPELSSNRVQQNRSSVRLSTEASAGPSSRSSSLLLEGSVEPRGAC